jgi:hypothetical protein
MFLTVQDCWQTISTLEVVVMPSYKTLFSQEAGRRRRR